MFSSTIDFWWINSAWWWLETNSVSNTWQFQHYDILITKQPRHTRFTAQSKDNCILKHTHIKPILCYADCNRIRRFSIQIMKARTLPRHQNQCLGTLLKPHSMTWNKWYLLDIFMFILFFWMFDEHFIVLFVTSDHPPSASISYYYWLLLSHIEYFQVILNTFKSYWLLSSHIEYFEVILNTFKSYWLLSSHIEYF